MKQIFFLVIISFTINLASFCQERQNMQLPKIFPKALWYINNATGWIKNNEGQWISGKNKIQSASASISQKALWNYQRMGIGTDNFTSITLQRILINGDTAFILVKRIKDGFFKYKSIAEGWTTFSSSIYCVFKNSTITKRDSSLFIVRSDILYAGSIVMPGENINKKLELDIATKIRTGNPLLFNKILSMAFCIKDNKAQFFISDIDENGMPGIQFVPAYSDIDFEKKPLVDYYYETSYSAIINLINLVNKVP